MAIPTPSRTATLLSLRTRIFRPLTPLASSAPTPPTPHSSPSPSLFSPAPSPSPPSPSTRTGPRLGTRYLTEPVRGEVLKAYYPPARVDFKAINRIFKKEGERVGFQGRELEYWKLPDLREKRRLEKLAYDRARGKGAPKKGQGRRATAAGKKKR